MYDAINDGRTRPHHSALDNFIAPIDDPIWRKIYPPNGFRCRCSTMTLTEAQARQRGWNGVPKYPAEGRADAGWDYNPALPLDHDTAHRAIGDLQRATDRVLTGQDAMLDRVVAQKLAKVNPVVAKKAADVLDGAPRLIADNASMKTPQSFVASAVAFPRDKQPVFELVSVSPLSIALAESINVNLNGKKLALDHDSVIHTIKQHGGENEKLRGQEPIAADDLALFGEIVNAAQVLSIGDPPKAKDGTTIITGEAVLGGFVYGFAARIRRKHVVPQSLWKRSIK